MRTVLRREYNGVCGVALGYFMLEAVCGMLRKGETWRDRVIHDAFWSILLLVGVGVLLILRTLKHSNCLLHVNGH
ncbi:MAG TPA: hypothetical protein VF269_09865 [Rhodanobacteraceae bacterium]